MQVIYQMLKPGRSRFLFRVVHLAMIGKVLLTFMWKCCMLVEEQVQIRTGILKAD